MAKYRYEQLEKMRLKHLPHDAQLVVQRQTGGVIPENDVQLYVAANFRNEENNQTVWGSGFSVQVQQIPEIIAMLQKVHARFKDNTRLKDNAGRTKDDTYAYVSY